MPNPVEGHLEVYKNMVEVLLVLERYFSQRIRRLKTCFVVLLPALKDIVNTIMGCCPVSSRLITIRQRAAPFNITIVQAYASALI